jgi:hypothetical protein
LAWAAVRFVAAICVPDLRVQPCSIMSGFGFIP